MSGADEIRGVQQQIAEVGRRILELEAALSAAKQARDGVEVSFLRGRLEQLDKQAVALREKDNLLLRAQQRGGHCSLLHHQLLSKLCDLNVLKHAFL